MSNDNDYIPMHKELIFLMFLAALVIMILFGVAIKGCQINESELYQCRQESQKK